MILTAGYTHYYALSRAIHRSLFSSVSSLQGAPIRKLVSPGLCQFNEFFQSVPLLSRTPLSSTSSVFRFGLPDTSEALNLSTCACILMKAEVHDEEVIRPYTPISTNALLGCFDLLIKNYGSQGLLSRYLHEMKVGDYLAFKHIPLNVKIQVPFSQKRVVMIAGGTGITPMIQVLHAILGGDSPDVENVTLLFGNQIHDEILAKNLLEQWADDYSDRFLLVHALSNESNVPNKSSYHRGYIDTDLIRKHVPTIDDDDTLVLVCGPPPMYESLCGPRDDTELTGVLKELGCSAENVYKF